LVQRYFQAASGRPLDTFAAGRIVFGRWGGTDEKYAGEEVIVRRIADDRLEIHGHGGTAASSAIIDALARSGAKRADWRTSPHLLDPDPIRAAAVVALARAATSRAAIVLLDQHAGALRAELESVRAALVDGQAGLAATRLHDLTARSSCGLHLTTPWRVVLAGRPNVGKSSLLNALVGYRRAIVHDQPGTTRDIVVANTAIDGWSLELADTAGLRSADDELESAGIALARRQAASADLMLLVCDRSRPWTASDDALLAEHPSALVVHNKCDLPDAGRRPAGWTASALVGQGIEELLGAIAGRLAPMPAPGAAVPFTSEQVERIQAAVASLDRSQPVAAIASIDGILSAAPEGLL
jgi:tRNA modification GTPase